MQRTNAKISAMLNPNSKILHNLHPSQLIHHPFSYQNVMGLVIPYMVIAPVLGSSAV